MVLLDKLVAILKGAQIGEEDPFAHLVAIEVEEGVVIFGVPLNPAVVGLGKLQGVGRADVVRGGIGLFRAGTVLGGRAGVPVIAVDLMG